MFNSPWFYFFTLFTDGLTNISNLSVLRKMFVRKRPEVSAMQRVLANIRRDLVIRNLLLLLRKLIQMSCEWM
jgi:hypothetical protein